MGGRVFQNIGIGIIGSLLGTAILIVVRPTSGGPPVEGWELPLYWVGWAVVIAGLGVALYALLGWVVRRRIAPRVRMELEGVLRTELQQALEGEALTELRNQIGLVEVFSGFQECQAEILDNIRTSGSIRIFLQIGRTVLRGGANFYDKLAESVPEEANVKILHASSDNPYLSERAAFNRVGGGKKKYEEWIVELDYAVRKIDNLKSGHSQDKIAGRQHKEGFIWRLFIFDDVSYMQPYLFDGNNSARAPVLKFHRLEMRSDNINETSLYKVFSSYFDLKWDENIPDKQRLNDLVPAGQESVVAAVARYHQFLIFALPKRYIDRADRELPFHGIGGKRRSGEDWLTALRREAAEELSCQLEVVPSTTTRFLTTGAELEATKIEDEPRPYCVYKRNRKVDHNFDQEKVLWLVAYEANLQISSLDHLEPRGELGALVVLTGEMLRRSLHGDLKYEEISTARDGSRLICADGLEFDLQRRAVPAGLATIVAAEYPARLMRRL